MKAVRNSLVLLAASVTLSGAAPVQNATAQDKSAWIFQDLPTNTIDSITLGLPPEPKLVLGSQTLISGLFVDLMQPKQTWSMLNPPVPAKDLPKPIPPDLLPKTAIQPNHDLAVHEPNFVPFRLSFP
jgi:hypothetical protein